MLLRKLDQPARCGRSEGNDIRTRPRIARRGVRRGEMVERFWGSSERDISARTIPKRTVKPTRAREIISSMIVTVFGECGLRSRFLKLQSKDHSANTPSVAIRQPDLRLTVMRRAQKTIMLPIKRYIRAH